MKKAVLSLAILAGVITFSSAQVFNTSSTLKSGQFSVGFEPGLYLNNTADINLFLHGAAGLKEGIDLSVKLGVMGYETYLGGDVEFRLSNQFSVAAGAHSYGSFGLDFTGLYTTSIGKSAQFYTGLDADINFPENDIQIPLWIPLGLEIPVRKYILFYFETEINITQTGSHFMGSGFNFLF